jgi:hypothetical protein
VPLVVILALVIGGILTSGNGGGGTGSSSGSAGALAPVRVKAPSDTSAPTVTACARVISALPLQLAGLDLRRTVSNPPSASLVAWGDPPIVLRCGVARPRELNPTLSKQLFQIDGVLFLPDRGSSTTVWTVVDRSIYLDITVPNSYRQPPLGPIANAVARVLRTPVCVQDPTAPRAKLCTRRR